MRRDGGGDPRRPQAERAIHVWRVSVAPARAAHWRRGAWGARPPEAGERDNGARGRSGVNGGGAPACEERPPAHGWHPRRHIHARKAGRCPPRAATCGACSRPAAGRRWCKGCSRVRGDRRAATALRRTTNGAFPARYPRACGVPNDGERQRPLSPRRYPAARAAVGDAAGAACCL
jgi:hypothetical protein